MFNEKYRKTSGKSEIIKIERLNADQVGTLRLLLALNPKRLCEVCYLALL